MSRAPRTTRPEPPRTGAGRSRAVLLVALVGALILGGSLAWWLDRGPEGPPRRVLLVCIDTCRADVLGAHGLRFADGTTPTPNLDALAARCLQPTWGLSSAPLTLPANVTAMCGLHPDGTGVRENDSFAVPPPERRSYSLLAEELRDAGFETGAFVSAQPLERRFGLGQGFRVYDQPRGDEKARDEIRFRERGAAETTARALEWLAGRAPDSDWFLFVHYFDPHSPYEGRPPAAPLPEDDPRRDWPDLPAYLGEVSAVDRAIGRLLAALPEEGEDVLVIVYGDHGEGFGEHGEATHGYLVHDATLRVPFLCKLPRGVAAAPRDVPPRLVDVAPTVRAVWSLPPPRHASYGSSLTEAAAADWSHRGETLYPYYQFRFARLRSFRDRELKLTEGGGRSTLHAWREDPGERHDLAAERPRDVERLRGRLLDDVGRLGSGRAEERVPEVSASHQYMASRAPSLALEPTEEENATLPHVGDRWTTVAALQTALGLIRMGLPGQAELALEGVAEGRDENPALLFWSARVRSLAGRDPRLGTATRRAKLEEALALYDRHTEAFRDPRSADAALRVLLDLHRVDGAGRHLEVVDERVERRKLSERVPCTALTFAIRGQARERRGDREGALGDFREAAARDPDNPAYRRDLKRLRDP